ncbi:hypothetical protein [Sporosarcina obsidiansis]|uniref:hypothetical protein n=1 Tax=Sporosarcina obsidiansis TaxID=2660748 RepID=UPI00129A54F0|nr:hypothetical protein [Sporosarcina obsidiansis]
MNLKKIILLVFSVFLLLISIGPLLTMARELWTSSKVDGRYKVQHAYTDDNGFPDIIDTQTLTVHDQSIFIKEETTERKAPLTSWDREEGVPPGDIVNLQLVINGRNVSTADPIWLSNRQRGSRYFSWLDVLTVKDRVKGTEQLMIVQRLSDDDVVDNNRKWKIITVDRSGKTSEEHFTYKNRSDHPLGVKLVNFSYTGLMQMGYYSDLLKGYPSLIFPFTYPFATGLMGVVFLWLALRRKGEKHAGETIS